MGNDQVVSLALPAAVEDALAGLASFEAARDTTDGGGNGGARGVRVGVRGRTVAGRTAAGGSETPRSHAFELPRTW